MKRRNFLKSLVGLAVATQIPRAAEAIQPQQVGALSESFHVKQEVYTLKALFPGTLIKFNPENTNAAYRSGYRYNDKRDSYEVFHCGNLIGDVDALEVEAGNETIDEIVMRTLTRHCIGPEWGNKV